MSDISVGFAANSVGSAVDYLRHKRASQVSKDLFSKIDTGGDGSISKAEMEGAVTGAGGTQGSADALFSALDPTSTGSVSQSQFLSGFQALAFSPANGAQLISAQAQSSAATDPAAAFKQQLFTQIDADGDGNLTQAELEKAVTSAGGTQASADALYAKLDPNGTGTVSADQFAANLPGPSAAPGTDVAGDGTAARDAVKTLFDANDPATKMAQSLFSKLDTNGDGVLTKDELEKAVTEAGGTPGQADTLYAKLDPNGTGSVTEQQFTQAVPKHHHHMHGGGFPPPDTDADTADTEGTTSTAAAVLGGSSDIGSAIDALLKSIAPMGQPAAGGAMSVATATPTDSTAPAAEAASDPAKQLEEAIQALLSGITQGAAGQGGAGTAFTDATTAMFRSLFNPNMSSPMMSTLIDMQSTGAAAA
jgi:Ca2+-binding EF-hand superfamily protein